MMMHEPLAFVALRGTLERDAPLARHTSWRAGGRADILYTPADRDDLATFIRQWPASQPVTVVGLGSNLLVRDGGWRGVVISLCQPYFSRIEVDGERLQQFLSNDPARDAARPSPRRSWCR